MVEVIVTMVVPATKTTAVTDRTDLTRMIEPARTEVYRLEFDDYAHAQAYLVAGKHGIDVRDEVDGSHGSLNFERLVGRIE